MHRGCSSKITSRARLHREWSLGCKSGIYVMEGRWMGHYGTAQTKSVAFGRSTIWNTCSLKYTMMPMIRSCHCKWNRNRRLPSYPLYHKKSWSQSFGRCSRNDNICITSRKWQRSGKSTGLGDHGWTNTITKLRGALPPSKSVCSLPMPDLCIFTLHDGLEGQSL
jgi:hypothetical protein